MTNPIKVIIKDKEYEIERGTTLLEISKLVEKDYQFPILLAKIENKYEELTEKVNYSCTIEFLDWNNKQANKVYLNSLIFLLSSTYKDLTKQEIKVNHSLDRGLYITTSQEITEELLKELESKMQEKVKQALPITKLTVERVNAISYYHSCNEYEKEGNMKYNTNTFMTLYKLEDYYDYYYSYMVPNTSLLVSFALTYLNEHGFILRYPTVYDNGNLKEYEHRTNVYNLFQTSREWAKNIDIEYIVDLNQKVIDEKIQEVIMMDEAKKNAELLKLAEQISKNEEYQIVLIAGPSSSGKTTTCNKLALSLKSLGKQPIMISMDDYFIERENTPLKEDGTPDYENLCAMDLELFNNTMAKLLNGEEVITPTYNFLTGKKEFKKKMKLSQGEVILIEGIHALNPQILDNIPKEKKCKIYLSALTQLNIDKHNRISTTDNRLLRRMIRDNRTRGHKVEDTLKTWVNVRDGEEQNIFPYQDTADYTLNTAMIYELGVLKVYAEPLLYSVSIDSPYYEDAKRLINFLRLFLPIPSDKIPLDSVLREFVGGSTFE